MAMAKRLERSLMTSTGIALVVLATVWPVSVAAQVDLCCLCFCDESPTRRCASAPAGECTNACATLGCDQASTIEACDSITSPTQECQLASSGTTCECVDLPTPTPDATAIPTEPPPMGACCLVDDGCVETTMEDCAGDYQGDGTICDENACTLCCRCEGPAETCTQGCQEVSFDDIFLCADGCPSESCVLVIAPGTSCAGGCEAPGCCAEESMCLQTDSTICDFVGGTFVAAGICDGPAGGCVVPTATATPTETPTSTPSATPTDTPTATPTNTPAPDGAPCADPVDCASGNCVADVCCDQPCAGGIQRCDLPGSAGTCVDVAATAPTTSGTGVLVGLVILASIAGLALRRRRDIAHLIMSL